MITRVKILLENGFTPMMLAALFYSVADILVKYISPSVDVIAIAFCRFFLGGLILWPLLLSRRASLRGQSTGVLLLRGLAGTIGFFCLLKSIAMIALANAMVLFYTFPLFATFFSFVLLRERFTKLELMLTMVGVIGIYILINPSSHLYNMGYIFGLLGGCFSGLAVVLIRQLRKTNGPLIIYFYFCVVGAALTCPFFVVSFSIPDFGQCSLLVLLAVIFVIAQLLMNQGFKFCKASEGSVILMSEVVFAGIAGVIIFKDALTPDFLVGAFLIVGSGVALNLINR